MRPRRREQPARGPVDAKRNGDRRQWRGDARGRHSNVDTTQAIQSGGGGASSRRGAPLPRSATGIDGNGESTHEADTAMLTRRRRSNEAEAAEQPARGSP